MLHKLICFVVFMNRIYAQTNSPCYWDRQANSHTLSGTQTNARSLDECMKQCRNSTICVLNGFDWNPSDVVGKQCWISNNQNLLQISNVDHYGYVCPKCTWYLYPNSFTQNGFQVSAAFTLDDCKQACLTNTNCSLLGFDWNANGTEQKRCWISTSHLMAFSEGFNHYLPSCINGIDTTAARATIGIVGTTLLAIGSTQKAIVGTTQIVAGTTEIAIAVSNDITNCNWMFVNNTNSRNGQLRPNISLENCKSSCLQNSFCRQFGFDWDWNSLKGAFCYHSTTGDLGFASRVDHWSLSCRNSTANCAWSILKNRNSPGGRQEPFATNIEVCRAKCLASVDCAKYGLDWAPSALAQTQCWISTSDVNSVFVGVEHHVFSCVNSNSSQSKTTVSQKNCQWQEYINYNSNGGNRDESATTIDQCKSECLTNFEACLNFGFDWNGASSVGYQCWLSTNENVLPYLYGGVSHYKYICSNPGLTYPTTTAMRSDNCQWASVQDVNSPYGTRQISVSTLDDCKTACYKNLSNCAKYGFDWVGGASSSGYSCYLSTSAINGKAVGVTHFNYQCGLGCFWSEMKNTNSPNGVLKSNVATLGQCEASCNSDPNCKYGVDWDFKAFIGSQCYFSTSKTYAAFDGVSHFNCESRSSTVQPSTRASGCRWNIYYNKTLSQRQGDAKSYPTLDECLSQCIAQFSCAAFEWRTSNQCYFYYVADVPDANAAGSNHYVHACS